MMAPYEACDLGEGSLLVVEQGKDFFIQPLLRMKDGAYRHPYNFGGPIATEGFVVERIMYPYPCTLNPFLHKRQNELLLGKAKCVKDAVWIDLTQPFKLRQTTRHLVTKAGALGVKVEPVEKNSQNIDTFFLLYSKHMKMVGALPHWKFPKEWFISLLHNLGTMSTLMFAKENDAVVGACLLIHEHGTCYYHFAATSFRSPHGASHRMVVFAAEHANSLGCKRFHLGGGVEANDGLFTFKAGFSDLRLPIYKYEE